MTATPTEPLDRFYRRVARIPNALLIELQILPLYGQPGEEERLGFATAWPAGEIGRIRQAAEALRPLLPKMALEFVPYEPAAGRTFAAVLYEHCEHVEACLRLWRLP